MFRLFLFLALLVLAGTSLQAQHYDELYYGQMGQAKTWADSGYYFMPNLLRFDVLGPAAGPEGILAAEVFFRSTDNSGLTFSGQATFFFREENLPPGMTINAQTRGLATVLLPQSLLFCPDEEQEQGMGQDDADFPLSLVGRFERIGQQWLDAPVMIAVQLNDFLVN